MGEGLDEDEKKLAECLEKAGLENKTAQTLVYIASSEEVKSREIEGNLTLRQPEVSIATKGLRERGWVTTEKEKKEGKGRPINIYSLAKPLAKIIESIEEEEREKIEDIEENLDRMEDLAGNF